MKRAALLTVVAALTSCIAGPPGLDGTNGIVGPMGEKGEKGDPGVSPPSITAVFPRSVAVGLEAQILISGTGTSWTDGTQVQFGPDVMVVKTKAASATALIVDIEVAPSAMPGTRDITVSSAGVSQHFRGAFNVLPLITMTASGRGARGSVVTVTVTHNDPAFEFDTSWNGSTFTGVSANLSPGAAMIVRDVKPHTVTLLAGIDIDAPLGMRDVRLINSWRRPSEVTFTFPAAFEVAELNEQELTASATGTFTRPFDSALYKFTPTLLNNELLVSVTTTNGKGAPMLVQVPSTGRFSTSMPFINSYTFIPYSTVTPYRFVAVEPTGAEGVDYTISVLVPPRAGEVEPNDTVMQAQSIMVPSIVNTSTIATAMDADFYKVTVTQAEVGRSLRMRTRAPDYSCDTRIELIGPDGTSSLAVSADTTYQEDLRSPVLSAPGDYYVKLTWGRVTTWSSYYVRYELLLNWE